MNKPCVGVYLKSGSYIGFSIAPENVAYWQETLSQIIRGEHLRQQPQEGYLYKRCVVKAGDWLEFSGDDLVAWRIFDEATASPTAVDRMVSLLEKEASNGDEWKGGGA